MTRVEREQLISRYLGGGMNTAEEQEFFIRVAVDKELRQDLRAQRTVESALRKDRDAESTGHTGLRMRVASSLAATPANPTTPTGAPAEALPAGTGAAAPASLVLKWVAGLAVGAIATASIVLLPDALRTPDRQGETGAVAPVTTPANPSAATSAPASRPAPSVIASPAPSGDSVAPADVAATTGTTTSTPDLAAVELRNATSERPRARTERSRDRREQRASTRDASSATDASASRDGAALDVDTAVSSPEAESFDRDESDRHDDSIDIGIKLQFPR